MAKSLVIGSFPSKAAQTGIQNGPAHKSFNYGRAPDFPEVLSTIISHSAPYHYFSQSQSFCREEEVGLLFLLNISKHSTKSLRGYKEALMSFWKPFSFVALQRKINYSFSQQISRKHEVLMENFYDILKCGVLEECYLSPHIWILSACPGRLLEGMLSKGPLSSLCSRQQGTEFGPNWITYS